MKNSPSTLAVHPMLLLRLSPDQRRKLHSHHTLRFDPQDSRHSRNLPGTKSETVTVVMF